jgi:hypothetical protein
MKGYVHILDSMLTNAAARVKHTTGQPGSTLLTVKAMLRGLGRSIVLAALAAVVVAAGRAVLGKQARGPGAPSRQRGSFDSWPPVPPAPGREVPNGSRVPSGS